MPWILTLDNSINLPKDDLYLIPIQIEANQELVAQGASNIFGSFFLSLPMAGSLSR